MPAKWPDLVNNIPDDKDPLKRTTSLLKHSYLLCICAPPITASERRTNYTRDTYNAWLQFVLHSVVYTVWSRALLTQSRLRILIVFFVYRSACCCTRCPPGPPPSGMDGRRWPSGPPGPPPGQLVARSEGHSGSGQATPSVMLTNISWSLHLGS